MYRESSEQNLDLHDINSQISVSLRGNFGPKQSENDQNLFEKSMSEEEFFNQQMKAAFNEQRPLTDDRAQRYFSGGTFYESPNKPRTSEKDKPPIEEKEFFRCIVMAILM